MSHLCTAPAITSARQDPGGRCRFRLALCSGYPTALSDGARYLVRGTALKLMLPTSGERHARQEYPCRADP
ncbi:protein of unknown function [Cupriavidus taiwanensis]|nr:protein of unknown function [Cupriavidus taiwanensis]